MSSCSTTPPKTYRAAPRQEAELVRETVDAALRLSSEASLTAAQTTLTRLCTPPHPNCVPNALVAVEAGLLSLLCPNSDTPIKNSDVEVYALLLWGVSHGLRERAPQVRAPSSKFYSRLNAQPFVPTLLKLLVAYWGKPASLHAIKALMNLYEARIIPEHFHTEGVPEALSAFLRHWEDATVGNDCLRDTAVLAARLLTQIHQERLEGDYDDPKVSATPGGSWISKFLDVLLCYPAQTAEAQRLVLDGLGVAAKALEVPKARNNCTFNDARSLACLAERYQSTTLQKHVSRALSTLYDEATLKRALGRLKHHTEKNLDSALTTDDHPVGDETNTLSGLLDWIAVFSHTTKACQQLVAESAIPLLLNVAIYESEKIVKPLSIEAITQIFRICAHVCAAPKLSISETWAHSIVNLLTLVLRALRCVERPAPEPIEQRVAQLLHWASALASALLVSHNACSAQLVLLENDTHHDAFLQLFESLVKSFEQDTKKTAGAAFARLLVLLSEQHFVKQLSEDNSAKVLASALECGQWAVAPGGASHIADCLLMCSRLLPLSPSASRGAAVAKLAWQSLKAFYSNSRVCLQASALLETIYADNNLSTTAESRMFSGFDDHEQLCDALMSAVVSHPHCRPLRVSASRILKPLVAWQTTCLKRWIGRLRAPPSASLTWTSAVTGLRTLLDVSASQARVAQEIPVEAIVNGVRVLCREIQRVTDPRSLLTAKDHDMLPLDAVLKEALGLIEQLLSRLYNPKADVAFQRFIEIAAEIPRGTVESDCLIFVTESLTQSIANILMAPVQETVDKTSKWPLRFTQRLLVVLPSLISLVQCITNTCNERAQTALTTCWNAFLQHYIFPFADASIVSDTLDATFRCVLCRNGNTFLCSNSVVLSTLRVLKESLKRRNLDQKLTSALLKRIEALEPDATPAVHHELLAIKSLLAPKNKALDAAMALLREAIKTDQYATTARALAQLAKALPEEESDAALADAARATRDVIQWIMKTSHGTQLESSLISNLTACIIELRQKPAASTALKRCIRTTHYGFVLKLLLETVCLHKDRTLQSLSPDSAELVIAFVSACQTEAAASAAFCVGETSVHVLKLMCSVLQQMSPSNKKLSADVEKTLFCCLSEWRWEVLEGCPEFEAMLEKKWGVLTAAPPDYVLSHRAFLEAMGNFFRRPGFSISVRSATRKRMITMLEAFLEGSKHDEKDNDLASVLRKEAYERLRELAGLRRSSCDTHLAPAAQRLNIAVDDNAKMSIRVTHDVSASAMPELNVSASHDNKSITQFQEQQRLLLPNATFSRDAFRSVTTDTRNAAEFAAAVTSVLENNLTNATAQEREPNVYALPGEERLKTLYSSIAQFLPEPEYTHDTPRGYSAAHLCAALVAAANGLGTSGSAEEFASLMSWLRVICEKASDKQDIADKGNWTKHLPGLLHVALPEQLSKADNNSVSVKRWSGCIDDIEAVLRIVDPDVAHIPAHRAKFNTLRAFLDQAKAENRTQQDKKVLQRCGITAPIKTSNNVLLTQTPCETFFKTTHDNDLSWHGTTATRPFTTSVFSKPLSHGSFTGLEETKSDAASQNAALKVPILTSSVPVIHITSTKALKTKSADAGSVEAISEDTRDISSRSNISTESLPLSRLSQNKVRLPSASHSSGKLFVPDPIQVTRKCLPPSAPPALTSGLSDAELWDASPSGSSQKTLQKSDSWWWRRKNTAQQKYQAEHTVVDVSQKQRKASELSQTDGNGMASCSPKPAKYNTPGNEKIITPTKYRNNRRSLFHHDSFSATASLCSSKNARSAQTLLFPEHELGNVADKGPSLQHHEANAFGETQQSSAWTPQGKTDSSRCGAAAAIGIAYSANPLKRARSFDLDQEMQDLAYTLARGALLSDDHNGSLLSRFAALHLRGAETITEGSYKKGFCPERKRLEQMAFKRCLREFNLLPQGAQQQVLVRSIAAWRQAVPFTEALDASQPQNSSCDAHRDPAFFHARILDRCRLTSVEKQKGEEDESVALLSLLQSTTAFENHTAALQRPRSASDTVDALRAVRRVFACEKPLDDVCSLLPVRNLSTAPSLMQASLTLRNVFTLWKNTRSNDQKTLDFPMVDQHIAFVFDRLCAVYEEKATPSSPAYAFLLDERQCGCACLRLLHHDATWAQRCATQYRENFILTSLWRYTLDHDLEQESLLCLVHTYFDALRYATASCVAWLGWQPEDLSSDSDCVKSLQNLFLQSLQCVLHQNFRRPARDTLLLKLHLALVETLVKQSGVKNAQGENEPECLFNNSSLMELLTETLWVMWEQREIPQASIIYYIVRAIRAIYNNHWIPFLLRANVFRRCVNLLREMRTPLNNLESVVWVPTAELKRVLLDWATAKDFLYLIGRMGCSALSNIDLTDQLEAVRIILAILRVSLKIERSDRMLLDVEPPPFSVKCDEEKLDVFLNAEDPCSLRRFLRELSPPSCYEGMKRCQLNACLALASLNLHQDAAVQEYKARKGVHLTVGLLEHEAVTLCAGPSSEHNAFTLALDVVQGNLTLLCNTAYRRAELQREFGENGACASLLKVMSLTLSHTLASSAGLMCPSTRRGLAAALKTVANLALCPFNIPLLIEHRITFFFETFLSLFIRMSKDQKYSETAVMSLLYVALRTLSNLVVEFTHDSMQSFQPTLPLLLELIRSSHQPSNTLLCLTFDTLSGLCRTPQNAARFYTLNGHTTVLYYLERISSGHHDHHLCQFLLRLIERQGAQCPVAFSTMQQQGLFSYLATLMAASHAPRTLVLQGFRVVLVALLSLPRDVSVANAVIDAGIHSVALNCLCTLAERDKPLEATHGSLFVTVVCYFFAVLLVLRQQHQANESQSSTPFRLQQNQRLLRSTSLSRNGSKEDLSDLHTLQHRSPSNSPCSRSASRLESIEEDWQHFWKLQLHFPARQLIACGKALTKILLSLFQLDETLSQIDTSSSFASLFDERKKKSSFLLMGDKSSLWGEPSSWSSSQQPFSLIPKADILLSGLGILASLCGDTEEVYYSSELASMDYITLLRQTLSEIGSQRLAVSDAVDLCRLVCYCLVLVTRVLPSEEWNVVCEDNCLISSLSSVFRWLDRLMADRKERKQHRLFFGSTTATDEVENNAKISDLPPHIENTLDLCLLVHEGLKQRCQKSFYTDMRLNDLIACIDPLFLTRSMSKVLPKGVQDLERELKHYLRTGTSIRLLLLLPKSSTTQDSTVATPLFDLSAETHKVGSSDKSWKVVSFDWRSSMNLLYAMCKQRDLKKFKFYPCLDISAWLWWVY